MGVGAPSWDEPGYSVWSENNIFQIQIYVLIFPEIFPVLKRSFQGLASGGGGIHPHIYQGEGVLEAL